jgi:hypothetical protein
MWQIAAYFGNAKRPVQSKASLPAAPATKATFQACYAAVKDCRHSASVLLDLVKPALAPGLVSSPFNRWSGLRMLPLMASFKPLGYPKL